MFIYRITGYFFIINDFFFPEVAKRPGHGPGHGPGPGIDLPRLSFSFAAAPPGARSLSFRNGQIAGRELWAISPQGIKRSEGGRGNGAGLSAGKETGAIHNALGGFLVYGCF